jgi:phosphinothricin acetyltransferase
VRIRPAEPGDLVRLTAIYNHYVETSHVTFDVTPLSVEQRREWFDHHSAKGPHRLLVAVDEQPIGYASSGRWRPKPAYDTTVELSIYCAPEARRRGIGRLLCEQLLTELGTEDVARVVGGAAIPNPASVALLTSLGFRSVGTFTKVGRKFGKYWDVQWFEKALRDPMGNDTSV